LTILIADLGLGALTKLQTTVQSWALPIVVLAGMGMLIVYMLGREDHSAVVSHLARWTLGGAALVGLNALALTLGI
jgi:hypothetical protein